MADTPKHSVSVAGIVVDDQDRVLVVQRRDNRHWEPPGGVLELDETPEEGVVREVREETGLEVSVERLTGVYKNMTRGVVALAFKCKLIGVFKCKLIGGTALVNDEARAVDWAPVDKLEDVMDAAYFVRVRDAFTSGASVVRVHDGVHMLTN